MEVRDRLERVAAYQYPDAVSTNLFPPYQTARQNQTFTEMIALNYPACADYQVELQDSYDVVVIGGGPAGATVSALLAEAGHRVAVLERSTVPRFHLGESLIPGTYWPLKRLGLIDPIEGERLSEEIQRAVFFGWIEAVGPVLFRRAQQARKLPDLAGGTG